MGVCAPRGWHYDGMVEGITLFGGFSRYWLLFIRVHVGQSFLSLRKHLQKLGYFKKVFVWFLRASACVCDGTISSVVVIVLVNLLFNNEFVVLRPYFTDNWVVVNIEVNHVFVYLFVWGGISDKVRDNNSHL